MELAKGEKVFNVCNIIFISFFSLLIILPIMNIVSLSFNDGTDSLRGGIYFWPRKFSLDNYQIVLSTPAIYKAFGISVLKTVIGVVTHLIVTGAAAYAMSKAELIGRKWFIKMGILTMFVGGGMIPSFLVIKSLGLYNSFWVYIIPALFSFYNLIIFMNFFRNLPASLEESAKIDGAGYFTIFFKIVLPLSFPVFATIALFTGVGQWNDFFTTKLYIDNPDLFPIQYYLYQMLMSVGSQSAIKAGIVIPTEALQQATMVITTLPIVLVYPFLQKYFISGMLVGGVKE
ncbi:carbohydrate ABC transporter permease [Neobacillus sp. NPDC058068]|uniref:carbohydrate ABC transporter permease n=1 Tax=Neobacillus sp. NPDC058068 TaxID=3346325 RepID=UPI0036DA0429